ncbi:HAT Half-A-TPR repeat [Fusarium oxysporum f. sp. vasinfectum]|nr:HAT Half-A-TPR repeat [Fusarium oxysporum f. sp. vasinfectum]
MAGVADKARFYLERAVPQLREWEEKEIFSKDEIRTIVQKRNDYEHRSLESLRSKRCKRLKIRHLQSAHAGQGRTLAIYERGVNRHPGSSALWREYLSYTSSVKASKRWRKTMTNALRMMPTDPELWAMAGRRSAKNGDMAAARGFFMRGCRFCTTNEKLWVEYARTEMEWLEKVDKRKAVAKPGQDVLRPDREEDGDELRLTAQHLKSNPAMDGAIPIAIFDISKKQAFFSANTAEAFFDLFVSFTHVPAQPRISQHVLDALDQEYPNHPATCNVHIRQPIMGVNPQTAEFPKNLREVLSRLNRYLEATTDRTELQKKTVAWIDGYLALDVLDEGIRAVLEHTKKKMESI